MKRALRWLLWAIVCGALAGLSTALLEVLVFLPKEGMTVRAILPAAIRLYVLVFSLPAVLTGLLLFPFLRVHPARVYSALLLPASVLLLAGGYGNLRLFPASGDVRSLLFDGALALAAGWLGVWLYRSGAGRIGRSLRRARLAVPVLLLALAGVGAAAFYAQAESFHPQAAAPVPVLNPSGPNVLFITVDAMRPDHMSVYGYGRPTTPNLQELAKDALLFRSAFANSAWTRASVATLFTSLYPSTHNVNLMGSGISPSLQTLPELLHARGYATGIFSANAFISPLFGYGRGVERFYHQRVSIQNELILGHVLRHLHKRSDALGPEHKMPGPELNRDFLEWARGLNGRPFFAYFHYMETHTPYETPAPYLQAFQDPSYRGPRLDDHPGHEGFQPLSPKGKALPPDQLRQLVGQYDAAIAYADALVGNLMGELRRMGLYDNTVVIVTADHGEEFYDHFGWGHGHSLYEETIHVPLLIRYPSSLPKGQEVAGVVRHVDLMPTVLELCGAAAPSGAEGRSLMPVVAGAEGPRPVYSEVFHGTSYARCVRQGTFKLIEIHVHSQEALQLFDLAQDPMEQHPLDPAKHPMGPKLMQLLASFREEAQRKTVAPSAVNVDTQTREKLRALGYVQ